MTLEKTLRLGLLYDFYGVLLTEKQRLCLEMHYLNDFSLAEIAADLRISRQAVYDLLRRAEQTLEDYEAKLGLVQKFAQQRLVLQQVYNLLQQISPARPADCLAKINQARNLLGTLLG